MDKYSNPNYGANAAIGGSLNTCAAPASPVNTLGEVCRLVDELHEMITVLTIDTENVCARIGAPGSDVHSSGTASKEPNGPIDYLHERVTTAMSRVMQVRYLVDTINARI